MNKKTKLLSIFVLAGVISTGVAVGVTGCKTHKHNWSEEYTVQENGKHAKTCDGCDKLLDEHDATWTDDSDTTCDHDGCDVTRTVTTNPPEATATVTAVTVSAAGGATSVAVDGTLQLSATVTGTNNPAQTVTWSTESTKVTVNSSGLVTGVAATAENEKVTIKATSTVDNTKYGEIQLTVTAKTTPPPQGGDDKYDLVTTDVNFDAVAKEINPSASGNFALTDDYTYKGKVTFTATGKSRFEVGSNRFNTQGESGTIIIKLSGVTNSLTIKGTNASGGTTQVGLSLTKDGSPVASSPAVAPSAAFEDIVLTDLPAGTYTLASVGGSARITALTLVEKMEKSTASGISVTALNVDFLKGESLSTNGLAVALNYSNGRQDALTASDYIIDDSQYNKNVAGKYTITVKYKENENFTATFDVYVYTIDEIEIHTIGVSNSAQVTLQQAITTGGTLNSNYLTVKGKGTVGEGDAARSHTFNLPTSALEIQLPATNTAGLKTASILVDTAYTTGGKTLSGSYDVVVKDKITLAPSDTQVEVAVGKTRDLKTLTQAIQYLKACDYAKTIEKVIRLDEGTYTEKVWIDMDNVTLIGSGETDDHKPDPNKTTITYSLVEGDAEPINGNLWGLDCATVHVEKANGFKAYNIEIRNDFDYIKNAGNYSGSQSSQGVALTLNGDGAVIVNCHLYGNQDTLYMESGRSYYYETQIDGNVDFIFGGETGLAYFDECTIVAINRTTVDATTGKGKEQNGYVTAAKHSSSKKPDYGYIFYKCNMTDDGKVKDGAMSLGRSWGDKATVAYIECDFSAAYSKAASTASGKDHRWADWSGGTAAANADFKEYGSKGAGAIATAVTGGKVISAADAANHTKDNIFGLANGKKVGYTAAWDYNAAYVALLATVNGDTLKDYTVTIKDTEGNTLGVPQIYTEGQTLSADSIKEYVNNLDSVKNDDKEVDKVYSSYTDATNNTELVAGLIEEFDGLVGESCEIIVSLKTIAVKTYDLLGYDGDQLQGGATGEYLGIKIETPNGGKFNNRGSDIQINAGTVLKVPVSGYSKVYMVDYNGNNTYAGSTFTLNYDTEDTQLYCVVTFKAQFYAKALVVDNTVAMRKVTVNEGQTVLGDIYVENNTSVTIAQIVALIEANNDYAGKELDKVYTDVTCETEYEDEAITADTPLYITVKSIQQLDAITETTTITFGSAGDYKSYEAKGVAEYSVAPRENAANNVQITAGAVFTFKSVSGATVSIKWYNDEQPQYGDDSCADIQVAEDGTITITFNVGTTGGSSGIYIQSITITVPTE